jgi:hypothetical protein
MIFKRIAQTCSKTLYNYIVNLKKEGKLVEIDIFKTVDKIRLFQAGKLTDTPTPAHLLTCNSYSEHKPLIPIIMYGTKVVLKCLDCCYVQEYIPECLTVLKNKKENEI